MKIKVVIAFGLLLLVPYMCFQFAKYSFENRTWSLGPYHHVVKYYEEMQGDSAIVIHKEVGDKCSINMGLLKLEPVNSWSHYTSTYVGEGKEEVEQAKSEYESKKRDRGWGFWLLSACQTICVMCVPMILLAWALKQILGLRGVHLRGYYISWILGTILAGGLAFYLILGCGVKESVYYQSEPLPWYYPK